MKGEIVLIIISSIALLILSFFTFIYFHYPPGDPRFTPLMENDNPLSSQIKNDIIDYMKKNNYEPSDYFIESNFESTDSSLTISLWDKEGIMNQSPNMCGNPGKCGTLLYDLKNKKVESFLQWK